MVVTVSAAIGAPHAVRQIFSPAPFDRSGGLSPEEATWRADHRAHLSVGVELEAFLVDGINQALPERREVALVNADRALRPARGVVQVT